MNTLPKITRSLRGLRAFATLNPVVALLLFTAVPAFSQSKITTVAGGLDPFNGGQAIAVNFGTTQSVIPDSAGGYYFSANFSRHSVYRVAADGTVTLIAGNGSSGFSGDGGPATSARLNDPRGLAIDGNGNLLIADSANHRIRKVTPAGVISTIAGVGTSGYSGDNGPALSARLASPFDVAIDGSGNLLIADQNNHRIRKVTPTGVITTVAGVGIAGFSGDQGPATSAQLRSPRGIAVAGNGNLLIADSLNHRIRTVNTAGIISTVAGTGTFGNIGDNGPAIGARLSSPNDVTADGSGNIYIADRDNSRIRKITPNGIITTVAGSLSGFSGDNGFAVSARLSGPTAVAVDTNGDLLIADSFNSRIRKVTIAGIISTVAGNFGSGYNGDSRPATTALLSSPASVTLDSAGNLLIADRDNHRIRKITPAGVISTIAGTGVAGSGGVLGPATAAQLSSPSSVVVDSRGIVYIADCSDRILVIDLTIPVGNLVPITPNTFAFCSDYYYYYYYDYYFSDYILSGLALDASGNLLVSDAFNQRVKLVGPPLQRSISVLAGTGDFGFSGDGGPAASAKLSYPWGIAVDVPGNIYFADSSNNRVRKITPAGLITTIAGDGTYGYGGDGGPATSAQLSTPSGLAVDTVGNLYIADTYNSRIRKVTPDGIITTVAGDGTYGSGGDGGPPTSANLGYPRAVALDTAGNLYIADTGNHRIRKVQFAPTVPTLDAISVSLGAQGTTIDIGLSGNSFTSPLGIDAGSGITVSNIRVLSETQATATFTIAANATIGTRNVNVTTSLGTSGNVSFDVVSPFPDLSITSASVATLATGYNGTYTLSIANRGVIATSGAITVTEDLPTGLTFVSGTGTNWSCGSSGQSVTCDNPEPLAPGASTTLSFTVAVSAATSSISHSAAVAVSGDPILSNNTTSIVTNVWTPVLNFVFNPVTPVAGNQATVGLSMNTPLSHDIMGKLTLTFSSDAVNPVDDPAVQFSQGGREVTFMIHANTTFARFGSNTQAGPIGFQTGTVAGNLSFSAALQTNEAPVAFSGLRTIPRRAPTIQGVRAQRGTGNTVNVGINLFSTSREVTQLTLQFQTTPAVTLTCGNTPACSTSGASLTLDVKQQFDTWFAGDKVYGSASTLTVPLSIEGTVRGTIVVSLRNAQGSSNSLSVPLP